MKKSLNPNHKFVCVKCVYSTNSRKDYNKHCTTKKHKKSHSKDKIMENVEFSCPKCGKTYKFSSGLSRHKKKCKYVSNIIVDNDNNDNINDNNKTIIIMTTTIIIKIIIIKIKECQQIKKKRKISKLLINTNKLLQRRRNQEIFLI